MSGWHRRHPDYLETGARPPDLLERADMERDNPPPNLKPLRACAACGAPTRLRWCSVACFRSEDGYYDDLERSQPEEDE